MQDNISSKSVKLEKFRDLVLQFNLFTAQLKSTPIQICLMEILSMTH